MKTVKNLADVLVAIGIVVGLLYAGVTTGLISAGSSGGGQMPSAAITQSTGSTTTDASTTDTTTESTSSEGSFTPGQMPTRGEGGEGGGSVVELLKNLGVITVISVAIAMIEKLISLTRKKLVPTAG